MSEYFRSFIKKDNFPTQPKEIRFKTNFVNSVEEAMINRGWKQTESELDWDIIWAERDWIREVFDYVHLAPHQKINHFRNHYEITRKDHMIKNLKNYKKMLIKEGKTELAEEIDFFPTTYNMPNDYPLFKDEFSKNPSGTIWIMKPVGKSQGKGIFLFDKLSMVSEWKSDFRWKPDNPQAELYVVQRYIHNPLLIGGKKFDLRLYVLCTNYNPLTLYFYRGGFARFTHSRYSNDDITNMEPHLTNVAIQKKTEGYKKEGFGGKWDLRHLKLYMLSRYGEEKVNECFRKIQDLIIHTYNSVQKVIFNNKHCFELYGVDIMIDDDLKPWMIETNACPSFTGSTESDKDFKTKLIDDTLTVLDLEQVLTGQEVQIGGYDLIYKGGPIIMAANSSLQTLLGCYNNRVSQSKQLAKSAAMRLAQKALEKVKAAANPKPPSKKYTKNFSTLPVKTGASYKDSYKEKMRKEREKDRAEKEGVDKGTTGSNVTKPFRQQTLKKGTKDRNRPGLPKKIKLKKGASATNNTSKNSKGNKDSKNSSGLISGYKKSSLKKTRKSKKSDLNSQTEE